MKGPKLFLFLSILLVSGAGAYGLARLAFSPCDCKQEKVGPAGEIAWMKAEFGLSEEEFRKVEALHLAYIPRCDEYCSRIESAHAKVLRLLVNSHGVNDDLAEAIRAEEAARTECRLALVAHLYETAAAMPEEQGRKFLRSAFLAICPSAHPNVHNAVTPHDPK